MANPTDYLVEECIVTSSFEAILAKIAEIPLKRATIHFNTRATSFRSLLGSHESSKVEVGIRDEEAHLFDEVVVTTPLGWLKSNKTAFEPRIDDELSTSIDAISIGHLEKVCSFMLLEPFRSQHSFSGLHHISQRLLEKTSPRISRPATRNPRIYKLDLTSLCSI